MSKKHLEGKEKETKTSSFDNQGFALFCFNSERIKWLGDSSESILASANIKYVSDGRLGRAPGPSRCGES